MQETNIDAGLIEVKIGGRPQIFKTEPLPEIFLKWQSTARLDAFSRMYADGSAAVRSMPAHLAVLATSSPGVFPVNLATRGIGLLPKTDWLTITSQLLEDTLDAVQGQTWQESLPRRVAAMREFYAHPERFEEGFLGGLEIFEGQTLKNLQADPRAALLYSGQPPDYPSFQFNGIVRLIETGDPYYRFLLAARELFAQDAFHIHQIQYPYGYLFYPVEIKNKTPFPRR